LLNKRFYRLVGALEFRNVDFVEGYLPIGIKKMLGLRSAHFVEWSIYATALHDTHAVIFGLAVANQIYRFGCHGRKYFGAKKRIKGYWI
jgi:hypothetical protein